MSDRHPRGEHPVQAEPAVARITSNPRVMGGEPCIRGMRVTVTMIAGLLEAGHPVARILEEYPYLEPEDVEAVIEFTRTEARDCASGQPADRVGANADEGLEPAGDDPDETHTSGISSRVQRIVDATLALPDEDQESVIARIIVSIEEEGGVSDREIERLWSGLVNLKLRRARRRRASQTEDVVAKRRKSEKRADGREEEASGSSEGGSLTYVIRSLQYPFLVEGEVDGLPFCLIEEGDTWRFVVSRDPALDPRAVRSNREGFVVSGCVGITRVRGEGDEMTDEQIFDLIDVSRSILRQRARSGRAKDAPGLMLDRDGTGRAG